MLCVTARSTEGRYGGSVWTDGKRAAAGDSVGKGALCARLCVNRACCASGCDHVARPRQWCCFIRNVHEVVNNYMHLLLRIRGTKAIEVTFRDGENSSV